MTVGDLIHCIGSTSSGRNPLYTIYERIVASNCNSIIIMTVRHLYSRFCPWIRGLNEKVFIIGVPIPRKQVQKMM